MTKLVWDKAGERFYETGVSNCALYLQQSDGCYGKGVAWNGITGITESPSGAEASDLYADNGKYATLRSAETFGATIEAYMSPAEFDVCDGTAEVAKGVLLGQQERKAFGLAYKTNVGNDTATDTDDSYKLHLIYGATASPSERAYATVNDSPEAITFSWEIETTPVAVEGYKAVSTIVIDSAKADTEKLAEFEQLLFGTTDGDPKLPLPDEVIKLFSVA
jgi:hypothetical protein